ncbi:hypothetical protein [Thermogutta sp.]|uniref:hypothetical protein n=1 Tax=Thermogutta sp. TaxID=1962930 RepID=UPI00321F89DD
MQEENHRSRAKRRLIVAAVGGAVVLFALLGLFLYMQKETTPPPPASPVIVWVTSPPVSSGQVEVTTPTLPVVRLDYRPALIPFSPEKFLARDSVIYPGRWGVCTVYRPTGAYTETLVNQCVARDDEGNRYIISWPWWVDSCTEIRMGLPVTQPYTLTVEHWGSTVYVVPHPEPFAECLINGQGYEHADPCPFDEDLVIVDVTTNGERPYIICASDAYIVSQFCWEHQGQKICRESPVDPLVGWRAWKEYIVFYGDKDPSVCIDMRTGETIDCDWEVLK